MTTSGIVDVDQAITLVFQAVKTALPGVQVLDGWDRVTEQEKQSVVVGVGPAPLSPAATEEPAPDEGGFCAVGHDVTVFCSAAAWDGEMEYKVKRGQAQALLTSIQQHFDAFPTLSGKVKSARLGRQRWHQISDEKTATVQVNFTVVLRIPG